jgi:hypothetical protein
MGTCSRRWPLDTQTALLACIPPLADLAYLPTFLGLPPGGSHDDRLERSIEVALTIKDEFGRVLTPKERWRQLNYE